MPTVSGYTQGNLARQILQRGTADDALTPTDLAQRAARVLDDEQEFGALARKSGDALALRHGLARLPLSPRFAELLALAEFERPQLFDHLLRATLISHYLALRRGLSDAETTNVLLAALAHDLGELQLDPTLFDPGHRLDPVERRHIYVHPIVGSLLVREVEAGDGAVATAVLQHQERIDGSGYPFGLHATQIGTLARIVGLSDVCASILSRHGGRERVWALLRLNRQKFDPELLALLEDALGHTARATPPDIGLAMPRIEAAAKLMARWAQFRAGLGEGKLPRDVGFLVERMGNLRAMLAQFGFDPEHPVMLMTLALEDAQVAAELAATLDEVHWQLADLEREIVRRRAIIEPGADRSCVNFLDDWNAELHAYLRT